MEQGVMIPNVPRPASQLRLAGLDEESIVDGPGLRFVVFTQGCRNNCKGCQNPQTHSYLGGTVYEVEDLLSRYAKNPLLSGMTFSGGEPFDQALALGALADGVHSLGGDVVCYTGYTCEHILDLIRDEGPDSPRAALLDKADILIDGPYVEALRDLDLLFRGSSNQRILDRKARAEIAAKRR